MIKLKCPKCEGTRFGEYKEIKRSYLNDEDAKDEAIEEVYCINCDSIYRIYWKISKITEVFEGKPYPEKSWKGSK